MIPINEGSRPSRFFLARVRAGEVEMPEAWAADPSAAAWTAEVEAAVPPPFDVEALRRRARGGDVVSLFRRAAPWAAGAFALAAAAILWVNPGNGHRTKGAPTLDAEVLRGEVQFAAGDRAVRAGDRIQFTYDSAGAPSLVLVGVDGTGEVVVYWPEEGNVPLAVVPGHEVLPGSILLDDAPGPEIFVAAFDGSSPESVVERVHAAWAEGGAEGVVALPASEAGVSVRVLDKE